MNKVTYYKQGKLDIRRTAMNRAALYGAVALAWVREQ